MTSADDSFEDDALASEYVLRLLDHDERRTFEDSLSGDTSLRALVHLWEGWLAPLANDVHPVSPPARVKSEVLKRIGPATSRSASWWNWRWVGAFGLAAIVAIAFLLPVLRGPVELTPSFQAELASADGSLVVTAGVIPATHEIVVERLAGAPPDGRVHELWLIAEGAAAPVSLGVLDNDGTTRIRVPDDIAPGVRTGTIAISDEPQGGSPTGAPTGTVLATGTFVDL